MYYKSKTHILSFMTPTLIIKIKCVLLKYNTLCFYKAQANNFKVSNDKWFSNTELRGGMRRGIENPFLQGF